MKWIPFGKKEQDDEWLLNRFQSSGDMEALGVLFDRYLHLVYGVCLKYLKNRMDAQDAAMVIFEKLTEKLPEANVQHFKSWLYVVTKNHCLMELRKDKNNLMVDVEIAMEMHPIGVDYEEQLNGREQALGPCMEQLSPQQQHCVRLFYLEEKSYKEIEAVTEYVYNEIKSHIQNGKRNLKKCLEQQDEQ